LYDLVAKLPGKTERGTAATKQDNHDDADDETRVALLWGFGTDRCSVYFIHDFYSFVIGSDKNGV